MYVRDWLYRENTRILKNQVVLELGNPRKIIFSSRDKNRWWSSQVYSRKCLQSNWNHCHSRDSAYTIWFSTRFLSSNGSISKFSGNILYKMSRSPSNKNIESESFVFQVRKIFLFSNPKIFILAGCYAFLCFCLVVGRAVLFRFA